MLGKEKCKILREVRRMIAQANDIPFSPPECSHEGPCAGTCPLCESELRYLEQQLQQRRAEGREIELRELCAGVSLDCGREPTATPPEWEDIQGDVRPREELAGVPTCFERELFSDYDL